ncbi:unnamed protein product [Cunninghamella blakesleeana]
MKHIYKTTYILAIPDLHKEYLLKHLETNEIMNLIKKNRDKIYNEIFNVKDLITGSTRQQQHTNNNNNNNNNNNKYSFIPKLKKIGWSSRTWVISEYQIAKEKYIQNGISFKYWFLSFNEYTSFFSYPFEDDNDDHQNQCTINNDKNTSIQTYQEVSDSKTFHQFIKSRFIQRTHLEMILNSNSIRNRELFYAILPLCNGYNYFIESVAEWNITDMTSVRLKLYETMNHGDL